MSERSPERSKDVEAVLRDMDATDLELLDPPAEVWENIAAATATTATAAAGDPASPAKLDRPQSRRRIPRRVAVMGIAAILLAAVGVSTYFAVKFAVKDDPVVVLSTAELTHDSQAFDPLGTDATARANLVEAEAGYVIDLAGAELPNPEAGADLEVWLIQPDATGGVADLVSLGVVDPANPGRLDVPPGHDPYRYFVVDISIEPRDGDPSHSGRSILRGPLQAA